MFTNKPEQTFGAESDQDGDCPTGVIHQHPAHMALSSQPQQLLGQPQVMPQFLLANGPLGGAAAAAAAMQQLLIQVSTGNGAQQLLSIPLSLAAGAGGQIQLLTTSNGQIIATNLANVPQPVNIAVPPPSAGM